VAAALTLARCRLEARQHLPAAQALEHSGIGVAKTGAAGIGAAIGGVIIGFLVTDSSLSTPLASRSPTGIPITVTTLTVTTHMIITDTDTAMTPTGTIIMAGPLTDTAIKATDTEIKDTATAIVTAEDPRLWSCNAGWLAQAITMVRLMESWDRQRDARCAHTNAATISAV